MAGCHFLRRFLIMAVTISLFPGCTMTFPSGAALVMASGSTLTLNDPLVFPNGSVSACGIQFAAGAGNGLYYTGSTVRIAQNGSDCVSFNPAVTTLFSNLEISTGKQIQSVGNGSAGSPHFYLAASPFPGLFFTTANGGTVGFSGNASTNHLLVTTNLGIVCGVPIRMMNYTVSGLPSAATFGAGARAFVTDALAPVFGSAVSGGGAVGVPVYSDGSTWLVG